MMRNKLRLLESKRKRELSSLTIFRTGILNHNQEFKIHAYINYRTNTFFI